MFYFLLPIFGFSINLIDKENACLLLANEALKYRTDELKNFLELNLEIEKKNLYKRVVEDMFYYCVQKIEKEDVRRIGLKKPQHLSIYRHLFLINLDYNKFTDFENSEKFLKVRRRINKRIGFETGKAKKRDL